jgi:hypothetical protein
MLVPGCASGEQWTFAMSRYAYEDGKWEPKPDREGMDAVGLLVLLALPLALDLVVLPITLPHDLVVMN